MTCALWADGVLCGATPVRDYLTGLRCASHTPAALAGRPEVEPDPARTLDGIHAAHGTHFTFRTTDTALNDDRAIASGRRRSNSTQFRTAQTAVQERRTGKAAL